MFPRATSGAPPVRAVEPPERRENRPRRRWNRASSRPRHGILLRERLHCRFAGDLQCGRISLGLVQGNVALEIVDPATGTIRATLKRSPLEVAVSAMAARSPSSIRRAFCAGGLRTLFVGDDHAAHRTGPLDATPLPRLAVVARNDVVTGVVVAAWRDLSLLDVSSRRRLWQQPPQGGLDSPGDRDRLKRETRSHSASPPARYACSMPPRETRSAPSKPQVGKPFSCSLPRETSPRAILVRRDLAMDDRRPRDRLPSSPSRLRRCPQNATRRAEYLEFDDGGSRILAISDRIRSSMHGPKRSRWTVEGAVRDNDFRTVASAISGSSELIVLRTGETLRRIGSQSNDGDVVARFTPTDRLLALSADGRFTESVPTTGVVTRAFDLWTADEGRARAWDVNKAGTRVVATLGGTLKHLESRRSKEDRRAPPSTSVESHF